MPIGPEDIERVAFKERFRGYDQGEVDRFLDRVAAGVAELAAERDRFAQELAELRAAGVAAPPAEARGFGEADELLRHTLGSARQTAEEVLSEARRQAEAVTSEARRRAEDERARVEADAGRIALAVEQLRRFRADYRARLHAVMAEQLAALDRAGELPRVPPAVEEALARAAEAAPRPAPPRDLVEAGWAPAGDDSEDAGELEAHAPWERAWNDPWSAEPAAGGGGEA